jgi:hypothetical protein
MTTPGFEVDPSALGSVAPLYSELASNLDQSRAVLQSTLDFLGDFWGNDEAGQQFAQNHVPGRDAALQYHRDLVTGVRSTGDGIAGWATGYTYAENSLVDGM